MFKKSTFEKLLRPAIDKVVERRYVPAVAVVEQIRREHPYDEVSGTVDRVVRRYAKELAAVAAVTGGTAAIPGAGTGTALATSGFDVAYSMTKLGEMILAIGIAHGHDARSIEERRTYVLTVLSMANGAATGIEGVAGRIGATGGAAVLAKIPEETLTTLNARLGASLFGKMAAEQGVSRLGRILPFGIGAGVGAAGNLFLVYSVARSARKFFATHPVDDPKRLDITDAARHTGAVDVAESPARRPADRTS